MNRGNAPLRRNRRSLRLRAYDYTQAGAYFVSITVQKRLCLFGEVTGERMRLNEAGRMVQRLWQELPQRFPTIEMDQFVIMPNHVHGIIVINGHPPTESAASHASAIPVGAPLVGTRNQAAAGTTKCTVGAPLVGAQAQDAREPKRVPTRGTPTSSLRWWRLRGRWERKRVPTRGTPTGGRSGAETAIETPVGLGDVTGAYKSLTTVEYTRGVKTQNWPPFHGRLWQRNYYEHVVRNDESLLNIRQYILYNPARWSFDRDNPLAVGPASERA